MPFVDHKRVVCGSWLSFGLGFFVAVSLLLGSAVSYVMFCPHFEKQLEKLKPEVKVQISAPIFLRLPDRTKAPNIPPRIESPDKAPIPIP